MSALAAHASNDGESLNEAEFVKEGETLEEFLRGKFKIIQKEKGYRFSIDSVLLANFVHLSEGDRVIDLGTGCGVIPLLLSCHMKKGEIIGVEIQPEYVDMASRSVKLNGMEHMIQIVEGDFKKVIKQFPRESFNVVISNPPYIPINAGRVNPSNDKAIARHEVAANLEDLIKIAKYLVKSRGKVFVVYAANRLTDLFTKLRENGLEPRRFQMVHSNEGSEAKIALLEAVNGGKPDLHVMRPLFVYNLEGTYTDEMTEILNEGNNHH